MAGTLYTYPGNFRAFKALVAAQYSGTDVTVVSEPPQFVLGETNKSDSFLEKFPLGKVPAFEAKNGDCVFESNAIAYYVANAQLRGTTPVDQALVQQWVNFAESEILPAACTWVFPCLGIMQYNKQNTERAKQDLGAALACLNRRLATKTFLVGERVTLADIVVACNLLLPYEHVLEPAFRNAYPNANRWFATVVNQPQFKAVNGDFTLCEKMKQFDSKKLAELSGKAAAGKGKEKKGQEKKAQAPKEKKVEVKKEEATPEPAAPKKKKDPWADVPACTLVWDDWKKMFAAAKKKGATDEDRQKAMDWFWEHFDTENCSAWFCDYNHNDELKMTFMSCNLIGGFLQRLEGLNKQAIGSMLVAETAPKKAITGVWAWRGQGLPFELSENWAMEYELYTWKKLDTSDPSVRKMFSDYLWQTQTEYGGLGYEDGKWFY